MLRVIKKLNDWRSSQHHKEQILVPPKRANVDATIVDGYHALSREVGEFFLKAGGRVRASDLTSKLTPFLDNSAQYDASSSITNSIPEYMLDQAEPLVQELLTQGYKNKDKHVMFKRKGADARTSDPSASSSDPSSSASEEGASARKEVLPHDIAALAHGITDVVIPAIDRWVQTLPEPLQKNTQGFYSAAFLKKLREDYKYLFSSDLIEEFYPVEETDGTELIAQTVTPPLGYVRDLLNDPGAHKVLGTRAWYRPWRSKVSTVKKYKKSMGLVQGVKTLFGFKNKHLLSEDDVVKDAVLRRLFEQHDTLDAVLDATKTLYSYAPKTGDGGEDEYERFAHHFYHNVHRLHKDKELLRRPVHDMAGGTDELHQLLSIEHALDDEFHALPDDKKSAFMAQVKESKDVLGMLRAYTRATDEWKEIVAPLIKPRTPITSRDEDVRNEGLLYRHGKHFDGMTRFLNQSDKAGYFYHLADNQHDKFMSHMKNFGGLALAKRVGLGTHAEILELKDRLNSRTETPAVPPNWHGTVYDFVGKEMAFEALKKLYTNLKDNADFFTPATAVRQVISMGIRGKFAELFADATHLTSIPDNPNTATTDLQPTTAEMFDVLKPAYMRLPGHIHHDKEGQLQEVRYQKKIDKLLDKLTRTDYTKDHDNVPTIAAIGMAQSRLGNDKAATKYLTMTINWAKKARDLKQPAEHFVSLANYELSNKAGRGGQEEERVKYLLRAFDTYHSMAYFEKSPYSNDVEDIERYVLLHPMNYEQRYKLLELWKNDSRHSRELHMAAHHGYSELETILTERTALPQPEREKLEALKNKFVQYSVDDLQANGVATATSAPSAAVGATSSTKINAESAGYPSGFRIDPLDLGKPQQYHNNSVEPVHIVHTVEPYTSKEAEREAFLTRFETLYEKRMAAQTTGTYTN